MNNFDKLDDDCPIQKEKINSLKTNTVNDKNGKISEEKSYNSWRFI